MRKTLQHIILWLLVLVLSGPAGLFAQKQVGPNYMKVKDNIIYLVLEKTVDVENLESFITKYNLDKIGLHQLLKEHRFDSLQELGWQVDNTRHQELIISKKLAGVESISKPGELAVFSMVPTPENWRVQGGNRVVFGTNRFKSKACFEQKDDIIIITLEGHQDARNVRLAGNFTNWRVGSFPMTRTSTGWQVGVRLKPGQYYYKFILNDKDWIEDPDNELTENDGRGNVNSYFFVPNHQFRLDGYLTAKNVFISGTFNNWAKDQLPMRRNQQGWFLEAYLEPGTHQYVFLVDGKTIRPEDIRNPENPVHSLEIGRPYVFRLKGFKNARNVVLAGNFNDWNPGQLWMRRTEDGWELPYVLGPGNYQYKFIVDGKWITDPDNPDVRPDGKGHENSWLVLESNYRFRLRGFDNAQDVYVAGEFNDWKSRVTRMKKVDGAWVADVYLAKGKHRYKFIVDGKWILDPGNKNWEENEFGTGNSVIWIE